MSPTWTGIGYDSDLAEVVSDYLSEGGADPRGRHHAEGVHRGHPKVTTHCGSGSQPAPRAAATANADHSQSWTTPAVTE
jgi:hypothetical protein